jgi:hypothetical protein
MIIWLKVTDDEYELPIAVASTARELAQICGTTEGSIVSRISHWHAGRTAKCPYRKVVIEEDD